MTTAPDVPTGLAKSSVNESSFTLSWNASTGATGYKVYKDGTLYASPAGTSQNITGLSANTTYNMKVIALSTNGESSQSTGFNVTTAPAVPTGLASSTIMTTSFNLSWNASTGATGYKIYKDGALYSSPGGTSKNITGLSAGTAYTMKVSAVSTNGESTQSTGFNVTTANWDIAWSYRKKITITNAGGVLTNYQIPITVDTATLITATKMKVNGDDIRFYNGTTELDYWIESGINTGTTKIWIEVNSIAANPATTDIYMYYGNATAPAKSNKFTTFIREIPNVRAGFNFDENAGVTTVDKTGGAFTGIGALINPPAWVPGKFGSCLRFNYTSLDDKVKLTPGNSLMSGLTDFTVSFWAKTTSTTGTRCAFHATNTGNNEFLIEIENGRIDVFLKDVQYHFAHPQINNNAWHLITIKRLSSSNRIHLYLDGAYESTWVGASSAPITVNLNGLWLGQEQDAVGGGWDPAQAYIGYMDELFIFDRALDAAEIVDMYSPNYYSYVTPNNSNRLLIRKYRTNEPTPGAPTIEENR